MEDQGQSPPPDQAHQCGLQQCHSPPDNKAAFVYDVGGPYRSWCCSCSSSLNSLIHSIGTCRMRRYLAILRNFLHSSLLHTLSFHPFPPTSLPSSLPSSSIYFLVYLSALLLPYSYIIFLGDYIFFHSVYMPQPM